MVKSAKLFSYLSKLSDLLLSEIREKFKDGTIYKSERSILVPDFSELEFKNGRIENYPKSKEIKKDFIYFHGLVSDLVFSVVLNLNEYKEVEKILKQDFRIKDHLINNFINKFVSLHARNYDKERNFFRKIIRQFVQEINGKGPLWKVKIFITGLWLEVDDFEIIKNVRLRKIRSSDFAFSDENELDDYFWPPYKGTYAVLEFNYKAKPGKRENLGTDTSFQVERIIGLLNITLLLFKFGSIFFPRIEKRSSILLLNTGIGTTYYSTHIKERKVYSLNELELQKLREFFRIIFNPKLNEAFSSKSGKLTHILIAYQRYYNSFVNIENRESQITYLISSLEAMLSEGGGELSRRLRQRAATILKIFEFDPLEVDQIINEAYGIRSKYSHGESSTISKEYRRKLIELSDYLFNYARILLQIEIQLYPLLNKQKFLKLIDKALIDEDSLKELRNLLNKNCKTYNIW